MLNTVFLLAIARTGGDGATRKHVAAISCMKLICQCNRCGAAVMGLLLWILYITPGGKMHM